MVYKLVYFILIYNILYINISLYICYPRCVLKSTNVTCHMSHVTLLNKVLVPILQTICM